MFLELRNMCGQSMECRQSLIQYLTWGFLVGGVVFLLRRSRTPHPYGRFLVDSGGPPLWTCPAKLAWFLQEVPSFLIPMLLLSTGSQPGLGRNLLLWTFCLHYFQRTFIYSLLTKGNPVPVYIVVSAVVFCSINGFLQGHYLLHCATYDDGWLRDVRLGTGFLLFSLGMAINIHSDYILRNLRKPGEVFYKIPKGGMFEYVSCANFFGEIVEWLGYAMATWSLPTFCFAFFTICALVPRGYHYHRYYTEKFDKYPKSRKAVIPFIL